MQKREEIVPIVSVFIPPERTASLLARMLERAVAFAANCRVSYGHWRMVRRSRRALHWLTSEQLRDIGLTRSEARDEYRRSYFID